MLEHEDSVIKFRADKPKVFQDFPKELVPDQARLLDAILIE